jgi:hypothetical protein
MLTRIPSTYLGIVLHTVCSQNYRVRLHLQSLELIGHGIDAFHSTYILCKVEARDIKLIRPPGGIVKRYRLPLRILELTFG